VSSLSPRGRLTSPPRLSSCLGAHRMCLGKFGFLVHRHRPSYVVSAILCLTLTLKRECTWPISGHGTREAFRTQVRMICSLHERHSAAAMANSLTVRGKCPVLYCGMSRFNDRGASQSARNGSDSSLLDNERVRASGAAQVSTSIRYAHMRRAYVL
jgi:hypothetical protein